MSNQLLVVPESPAVPPVKQQAIEALEKRSGSLFKEATELKVTSEATFEKGGQIERECKNFTKALQAELSPTKKAITLSGKLFRDFEARALKPINDIMALVTPQMDAFQEKKRKIREEQERKAREEAMAKAKAERDAEIKRMEAEREAARKAHEAKMAELKKQRDAESKVRAEQLAVEEAEREAERVADIKEAEESELVIDAVPEKAPVKKSEGQSLRQNWKFTVTDPIALFKACIAGEQPMLYVSVNEAEIGKVIRATKGQIKIPGISTYVKEGRSHTGY